MTGSINASDGTTNTAPNVAPASLAGFSIEMVCSEADSLSELAHRLPAGTEIFLNVMPRDRPEDRIRICRRIKALGLTPVPHIAARQIADKGEVQQTLDRFTGDAGVDGFLIIAGDLDQPAREIRDSLEFIRAMSPGDTGIRKIGISGYPEGHPLIPDEVLLRIQQDKISVLRDLNIEPFIVTQFSFDANAIIRYCEDVHSRHPDMQIKNGLPGPAKLTTLVRYAHRCGVKSSMKKLKALPVSSSLRLMQRVPPTRQAQAIGNYKLAQNNNVTVHLFTFGGLEASLDWVDSEIADRSGGPDE